MGFTRGEFINQVSKIILITGANVGVEEINQLSQSISYLLYLFSASKQ